MEEELVSGASIRILLLAGSAGHLSHVRISLEILADLLKERNAHTYLWDLYDDPLPVFNPIYYHNPHANNSEVVRRLAQLADLADAFVWASPVYHNSFSGVLKNALDSLTSRQFCNKPVALISSGNSERTGVQPCDQLRIVARGLLAIAIPAQIVTISSDFELLQDRYRLVNESIYQRFVHLADELLSYSVLMRQLRRDNESKVLSKQKTF